MLKKKFDDEVLTSLGTINKIKLKSQIYLVSWVVFLFMSGVMYWASTFTVVDFPALSSIAKLNPVSFELTPVSHSLGQGEFVTSPSAISSIASLFSGKLRIWVGLASVIILSLGFISYMQSRNVVPVMMSAFLAGMMTFVMPVIFDDSDKNGVSYESTLEKIEFDNYIKSGDVKGYVDAIANYSSRGGFIINSVIDSRTANQDDAINLLDVFPKEEAQKISVGLSETVANAISNGDETYNDSLPFVSALSAHVLSSVERDTHDPIIDDRTGFAIFDSAKDLKGFNVSNLYSDEVTAEIASQKKLRAFLVNVSAVLFGLVCVLLWLWAFSFRNAYRAQKVFIEEDKLRKMV